MGDWVITQNSADFCEKGEGRGGVEISDNLIKQI